MIRDDSPENAASATIRGALPALLRAAQRAREIAAQTGTAIVVTRNGVIEHIYPGRDTPASADAPPCPEESAAPADSSLTASPQER